ncbi:hypothetical protein PFISCL1PPCAC_6510 [Pristionchus fissidentatus]|uniref:NADAR domain-containing protein n=1 Tax=Pristionchus fissidentatus TaxID=1538716 RepID=A0AAV5V7P7_9BILA|nr:hypothetical protein PFISCL1PPCAC_6510 [Pristionchus fissidentatus]
MSYFGSFSTPRDEPYGSSRFSTTDSTWTLSQPTNQWSSQPQQPRYEQPRYGQVFDPPRYEQPFSSRPLNPMVMATAQPIFPQYSYMSGNGGRGNSFSNDRFDDRRGRGGDTRQWIPQDDRRGVGNNGGGFRNDSRGGNRNGNNGSFSRNGDNRRQNSDRKRNDNEYVPRRTNSSPKVNKNKDYTPSRIAPASNGKSPKGNKGKGGDNGRREGGKDRGARGGERGPMRRKNNRCTDLEFKSIPADAPSKSFAVKGENLVCFQGLQSVLTTQHEFPIVIEGEVYTSVDHFYQNEKCKQLSGGKECDGLMANIKLEEEFTGDGSKKTKITDANKNYGKMAREFLKENKIDRKTIEEWRRAGGVIATYTAMKAKAQQCAEMREFLHTSVNKIIVHTYWGDAIFGSGTEVQFVHKWADEMAKTNSKLQIPLVPLTDVDAIAMAPQIAEGRNILGLIHMQLAEEIGKGSLPFVVTSASLEMTTEASPSAADTIDVAVIDLAKEEEDEVMEA